MRNIIFSVSLMLIAAEGYSQTPKKAETVTVNGTKVYYEVYGKGQPLFLLHGYSVSSKSWHSFIADYASDFEVYLVDLKGHGKSDPFTKKLSFKAAAKDLEALIEYLKLDSIKAIGMSYGADIAFQLAILQPNLIRSMIAIGACGTWNAKDYPDWLEEFSYKNVANLTWMQGEHASESQVKSILDQFPNYQTSTSDNELKSIQTRTLIILGDQDKSIPLECVVNVKKNMTHFNLWILPETGHSAHEGKYRTQFVQTSKEFLKNTLNIE